MTTKLGNAVKWARISSNECNCRNVCLVASREEPQVTLVEFLLARIAADEANALSAAVSYTMEWPYTPARVLAECTAQRAIIEIHRFDEGDSDPCDAHDPDFRSVDCDTLLLLAAPYASHPDFEPVWGTP
jgi:Family of unknown function (DUF6221)